MLDDNFVYDNLSFDIYNGCCGSFGNELLKDQTVSYSRRISLASLISQTWSHVNNKKFYLRINRNMYFKISEDNWKQII